MEMRSAGVKRGVLPANEDENGVLARFFGVLSAHFAANRPLKVASRRRFGYKAAVLRGA